MKHEAWSLGDYVHVEDKDLGLSVTTRVIRREYNLHRAMEYGTRTIHYP